MDTIYETLKHLVVVEDVYAHIHNLTWFAERSARLSGEYIEILKRANATFLDAALEVTWFDFPLTKHDGLL